MPGPKLFARAFAADNCPDRGPRVTLSVVIPELRQDFNRRFRPEVFQSMLEGLDAVARTHVGFPVAETPCFFPKPLLEEIARIGIDLTLQLVCDPKYLASSLAAIPEQWRAAAQNDHPHFLTADFGLVREEDGRLAPRLVEMQAFPSVFGFQWALSEAYRSAFSLDGSLQYLFGGLDEAGFWKLLGDTIVAGHDPETVVLIDVDPASQKTLPDFHITADRLGIKIVDIADVQPISASSYGGLRSLAYRKGGRLFPIRRIYNRAIVDELVRRQIRLRFDYREAFDVEWAGHPNWYFHVSKFSLPWLHHSAVPPAVFLEDWFRPPSGDHLPDLRERLPQDRNRLILKPLYSFAGQGIVFAPTDAQLAAIPLDRRADYLLQERVTFVPIIDTPFGATQAEIRILYVWPDSSGLDQGKLIPLLSLVRLGRGQMMGVDHNRDQRWVGASAAFFGV